MPCVRRERNHRRSMPALPLSLASLHLDARIERFPEHFRRIQRLDAARWHRKVAHVVEAHRVFHARESLGQVAVVAAEGLEAALLESQPARAPALLALGGDLRIATETRAEDGRARR